MRKFLFLFAIVMALCLLPAAAFADDGIAMHRLYNQWSGEHFYTSDDGEFDNLVSIGWTNEGTGWKAPEASNTPVFRMYNPYAGEHHYTMDASEKDGMVAAGWVDEGVGWYSDDAQTVPLFREYNPNEPANNHNYTTSEEEHRNLVAIGWADEGIAWYGVSGGSQPSSTALRFGTGGEAGTYYAVGTVIAQNARAKAGLDTTAVTSGGSQANVLDIDDGVSQLGFCQSDIEAYAFQGTNLFEGVPVTSFSTVAALYDEPVQIVTCNESIKTVADLKGKNVSIGTAGSGVYFNAIDVLGAYGIAETDITPVYQSFNASVDALKDGKIDAAFIVAGAPTTAITDLSTSKTAYLVALDDEHIKKLIEKSPYYSETTIKANTYPGQTADVATISVGAVVIAADTCSEDDIYAFVSSIFDNLEELKHVHAKFGEFSVEKATSVTAVPYHPGAAKYFKEKGIEVATK